MSYQDFTLKDEKAAKSKIDYWISKIEANYSTEYSSQIFRDSLEVSRKIEEQIGFDAQDYLISQLLITFSQKDKLDLELTQNIIIELQLPTSDEDLTQTDLPEEFLELIKRYSFEFRQRSTQQNFIEEKTTKNIQKHKRRNKIFGAIFILIVIISIFAKWIVRSLS